MINPVETIVATQAPLVVSGGADWRRLMRPARDFLMGLAAFAVVVLVMSAAPHFNASPRTTNPFVGSAHASILTVATPHPVLLAKGWGGVGSGNAGLIYRSTDQREALMILGTAFAAILTLNLALLRHLRSAYTHRGQSKAG